MDNYAKIGGILTIISGAITILKGIAFPTMAILMCVFIGVTVPDDPEFVIFMLIPVIMYGIIGLFYILLGVFSVIGGTFALKKQHWIVALIASIAGAFVSFATGIAAIILITMAKDVFTGTVKNQLKTGQQSVQNI